MSFRASARRRLTVAAFAAATATLATFAISPAFAGNEPYLGWDFGGGVGIGVGVPPSAYDRCPSYGWVYYPYRCRYRPIHYRHYHRHHFHHPAPPPGPSDAQ